MSDVSDLNRHTETTSNTPVVTPVALEPSSYEAPGILYAGEDRKGGLFMEYFRTLARYRWLIIGCGVCGIVLSFLMNFNALPVFRARTSLDIQSVNNDFMNMKAVAPTEGAGDPSSDEYVQTQIKLLQSQTLLDRTVDKLKSEAHPDYIDQMDLASQLERALYVVPFKRISFDNLVEDTSKHVTVKPLGITRLVEITCDSWSAEMSAKFCNTLVEQFREGDLEMRGAESKKTSDWLTKQVADVKVKAEESEKRLEAATGGNNLILSQESTGVEEDRLRQMQTEYVRAEADRMAREADAGIGPGAADASAPDLATNPAYSRAIQHLAELQGALAGLSPDLTEADERKVKLRAQMKVEEKNIADLRAANEARLKNDYQASLHREAMAAAAYHAEEGRVSADLGKASQVSLLRREVESEQQLYQTLLGLAREAGFASAIHASTIRVVDAAEAAKIPFTPRRGSAAGSGLLLGTLCGVGLAFFIDRSTTVFRVPGDTERYLGLRELGVIPSSLRQRKAVASLTAGGPGGATVIPKEAQPALSNWTENFSIVAEAYRSATTSIMLSEHPREHGRIYVLSSANAGEGKTTVTSNLGVALSKSRLRVLLIDGDLRKPALHKVLQVPNEFGLRNLLRGESVPQPTPVASSEEPSDEAGETASNPLNAVPNVAPSPAVCYQPTALPNLFVLPAGQGTEEVVELLHSSHTGELLKRLRTDFDVVIIDTPPMLHMADTRILASHAQGAILVVRAGLTTRDEATKARDLFDQDRVRMVGTILNDFNPDRNGLPNYYKSYYRYMEDVSTAASGTVSWLEGLLSRERRNVRRTEARNGSSSGGSKYEGAETFDEAQPFDEVDAFDFRDVTVAAHSNATENGLVKAQNGLARRPNGNGALIRGGNPPGNGATGNGTAGNGSTGYGSSGYAPMRNGLPAGDPSAAHLDGVVSQLFSRMFDRGPVNLGPMEGSAMDAPPLGDSQSVLYVERTQERRRTGRREFPPLVAYYWDGGSPRAHDIRDISASGFYLFTEERWYPGTQVMILLQRPGDAGNDPERSITVNAKVVRFGVDGIGFSFVMPEKKSSRGGDSFTPTGADRNAFYRFLQRIPEDES